MRARLQTFGRVAAITGLIYALLLSLVLFTGTWWTTALRFLGVAAIFGGALGLIVLLLRRTWSRLLVLLLVAPALSLALYFGADQLPHGAWIQLPTVPAQVVAIDPRTAVSIYGGDVLVRDVDGGLWLYACGAGAPCAWAPVELAPGQEVRRDGLPGRCQPGYAAPEAAPRPPGRVLDRQATKDCQADFTLTLHTALLADGSVWVWQRSSYGMALPALVIFWFLVGLLFAVVTPVALWLPRAMAMARAAAPARSHAGTPVAKQRLLFWLTFACGAGLYAALVAPYAATQRWWATALRLAPSGALVGGVVGLAGLWRDRPWRRALAIVAAMALALALHLGLERLPRGRWMQLPNPPAPLAELLGENIISSTGAGVLARTARGTGVELVERADGLAWRTTALPATTRSRPRCDEPLRGVPRPPGVALDTHDDLLCRDDHRIQQQVALLADGSVWLWRQDWRVGDETRPRWIAVLAVGLLGVLAVALAALNDRKAAQ